MQMEKNNQNNSKGDLMKSIRDEQAEMVQTVKEIEDLMQSNDDLSPKARG